MERVQRPVVIKPERGILTFEAEGTEGGRYHSRVLHVPTADSGVTIGRGYDMKTKSPSDITNDLISVGVEPKIAQKLSAATGLSGERAKKFIEDDDALRTFEISERSQLLLFQLSYAFEHGVVRRICEKPDAVKKYGRCDLRSLHPAILDLVVDLKFRGDYTTDSRLFLQRYMVQDDLEGFVRMIVKRDNWRSVPVERFERRKRYALAALAAHQKALSQVSRLGSSLA